MCNCNMKCLSATTSSNTITLSSLVERIKRYRSLLLLKNLAANDTKICDASLPSIFPSESQKISSVVKMRWKQLARNAFNHSLSQKNKSAAGNNGSSVNGQPISHPVNTFDETFLGQESLIDLLTLNAPGSDGLLNCQRLGQWVQLSGHEDSFALAGPGTIWKKRSSDSTEVQVYEALKHEPIAEMIPKFYRDVQYKGDNFIELEDLLYNYKDAAIMDIKMGMRTFLETEVTNNVARHDLYEKMVRIDPLAPTREEHDAKAVTKLRYMRFRENLSSSSNLGFRIEGFKVGKNVKHNKNLHMIKRREDVRKTLEAFFTNKRDVCHIILNRLRTLRKFFENSTFFQKHEVIGSSLLIIYTADKAGVWMIDFAKTLPVDEHVQINHRQTWHLGNHEDGYLFGLDNLISIFDDIVRHKNPDFN